ncbi:hypothetical protein Cs308_0605 [Candidatus Chlamydia sanziniae]|uniref:Uncharacterized protein n=1 Tax=Candidatus Chlamydia sanziniae TaxID=1806891 RepID=A0A1A9HVB8_9CHLA|nr:hypothetical protein Cs308_0605 [Candidatus Chlamydia sanziniae]
MIKTLAVFSKDFLMRKLKKNPPSSRFYPYKAVTSLGFLMSDTQ